MYLHAYGLGGAVQAVQRGGVHAHVDGAQHGRHHGDVHGGRVASRYVHEELVLAE